MSKTKEISIINKPLCGVLQERGENLPVIEASKKLIIDRTSFPF